MASQDRRGRPPPQGSLHRDLLDGYYINLDRSPARREAMDEQLARHRLDHIYQRFPAVDGTTLAPPPGGGRMTPGMLGISQSHHHVLAQADGKSRFIHVMEDDVVLSEYVGPVIGRAIAKGQLDAFDIVLTDIGGFNNIVIIGIFKRMFDKLRREKSMAARVANWNILDLASTNFATLTSYIVNRRARDRVLAIYKNEMRRGPKLPVDLVIRRAVQERKLRGAFFFPFLTTVGLESIAKTQSGRAIDDSRLILALLRYAFFIDCDVESYGRRFLDEVLARSPPDESDKHGKFLQAVTGLILSEHYKEF